MFGVWPHVVRSISTVLWAGNRVGFYVDLDRNVLRCSVTVAESDMLRGYILLGLLGCGKRERQTGLQITGVFCWRNSSLLESVVLGCPRYLGWWRVKMDVEVCHWIQCILSQSRMWSLPRDYLFLLGKRFTLS